MTRRGTPNDLTPEQTVEATELFALGWSYRRIGERIGHNYEQVRRALDADFATNRRIQVRDARQRRYKPEKRIDRHGRENASGASVKEDAAARLAEIPADTRTLTQRLCGDPIPNDPRRARHA
jgi:hypothetical protein